MKILDCESIESTRRSLHSILGIGESRLNALFDSIDISDGSHPGTEPQRRLMSYVVDATRCQVSFDATCFFHFTRTFRGNTFDEGLLPLDQIIGKIWDFLFRLTEEQVTSQQWADLRRSIHQSDSNGAHLYTIKLADPKFHGGPHAFLIRETAIKGIKVGSLWDYFKTPEIVEDICNCCAQRYGIDLTQKFIANTTPCIVKFTDYSAHERNLRWALLYAYQKRRNLDFNPRAPGGFSGDGKPVPKDRIRKVKFLPRL
jgi:hypothetical protein